MTSTSEPLATQTVLVRGWRASARLAPVRRMLRDPIVATSMIIVVVFTVCALFAPLLAPYNPYITDTTAGTFLQGPSSRHLLGTDVIGRDLLSRMLYGARVSLGVGVLSTLLGAFLGVFLGLLAGFLGGLIDDVIMRCMDVLLAFPALILALGLLASLGRSVHTLVIAIGIGGIAFLARLVRSQVLSVRELDYVLAARTIGAKDARILFRHIWPNCTAPVIVSLSLGVGFSVLAESGLSFLGLGVPPPTPSWGSLLQDGFQFLRGSAYLSIAPGVAISLLILSLSLIGDGLRDALDPSLRGRG
jgi:ABC-type dipeptide/oligopeptide/nickel transport system permease subunit